MKKKPLYNKLSSKIKPEALFLLPSLLGVLLFFIIPFLVVIVYSMVNNPMQMKFVFFDNFEEIIKNEAFQLAVKNTATFSLVAVPLAVVLSMGLALLLEMRIPGKSKIRTMLLSPMMVPVASVVLIWQVLFHSTGPINDFLSIFGVEKIDWLQSSHAQMVVLVLFLWKNLGYNMILFMAALSSIPKDILEVAEIERANPWFKFVHIKLRFLSPTILFVTILSLINSFKVFREIHLLAGDYPYESLYMLQHFMNNTFKTLDYQKLATAAVLMTIVMIIIIIILFVCESRFGKDVEG